MNKRMTSSKRVTKRQMIYDALYGHIVSGQHPPGTQLTPVKKIAKQFKTGVRTVQQAIDQLESEGYIVSKHGAGTFVTGSYRSINMDELVTLCVEARGHLWSDLCGMLMEGLAERESVGMVIGTETKDEHHKLLIRRAAHSQSGAFIVQGNDDFPFEVFDYPALKHRPIIAVVQWVSDLRWPNLHRVLHDSAAAGCLVAEHLWDLGHRNVLCIDSSYGHGNFEKPVPNDWAAGYNFVQEWTRRGGRWSSMVHRVEEKKGECLGQEFIDIFKQPEPPTAVFGMRDWETWLAQQTILQEMPELRDTIALVGYGNTPWSQAGSPPFTTVDFQLGEIAVEALNVLDAVRSGDEEPPELIEIQPKLIVRRTSYPARTPQVV